jgi:3D (Asp-Asp-Asp) domain-containing protein
VSAQLAEISAPNAQAWRAQAEQLADENAALRAEIERLNETAWQPFEATAYTADCVEGCTGITATGLDVRNRTHYEGKRIIAADPSVIPLGTTVELRFSNGTLEQAIAMDTGGAIDGNIIDYLISDHASAIQFGRQTVNIRILERGSELMTKFLFVTGDDYAAMHVENKLGVKEAAKLAEANGGTHTIGTDEVYAQLSIVQFGDVDPAFVAFVKDAFIDYDTLKHENFYVIEEAE